MPDSDRQRYIDRSKTIDVDKCPYEIPELTERTNHSPHKMKSTCSKLLANGITAILCINFLRLITYIERVTCGCTGPETWWIYYPSASGGMQSPIDVTTEEVLFDPELKHNPLQFSYWRASAAFAAAEETEEEGGPEVNHEKLVLVNTGNTARVDVDNASSCKQL